jgi:Mg-chelatase subunit ChlD
MQNIKFNENFYLTIKDVKTLNEVQLTPKALSTNFIFVIDVSGSMSGDLGYIRTQLKNKLPQLVKDGDTVTIIWFSGRNDAGILMEEVEVRSLKKLQDINTAIDRFLKPIGLTAFYKPLVLAKEAIQRIKKNRSNGVFSLIFLTDGGNNDCSWSDVIKSLKDLEADLAASTFVEYGYYADSNAIAKMAELLGGEKVEAEQFDDYDVVFENKLQKTYGSSKKVLVDIPTNRVFDFAFTVTPSNEIILYGITDNQILVPEDTISLMFFSNKPNSSFVFPYENKPELNKLVYTSLYVLTEKLQNDYADDVFKVLGDKNLYDVFTNAYGKQKLFNFKNMVKECVFDNTKQFLKGRVANLVMDENAYCVMNFISDLSDDEGALVYPLHEEFSYKRIGAKKVAAGSTGELNESQKALLAGAKSVEELKAITDSIAQSAEEVVKFEYNDKTKGYSISNLVWSSERANLSINVKFDGYVNLPKNKFGIEKIDTFIFRNYTIIKDGILNITKLPVTLSKATFALFQANGIIEKGVAYIPKQIYILDFSALPIINKKMVKAISAKTLAEKEYSLLKLQGLAKAYKYFGELHFPKVSTGFVEKYGADAEVWLKELGITTFNGFNPKMLTEKSTDFYMAVELNTKIAKLSTIPTVASVLKKIEEGKALTPADELLKPAIDDYNAQVNSPIFKALTDQKLKDQVLENWLKTVNKTVSDQRKQLLQEIAQIKFSLILSKKWFTEFKSFEEDTLVQKIDGKDLTFKFELTETQINL